MKYRNIIAVVIWYGEGNGTPLQYSCLEDPMGGGAWWAAVHGVAEGRTRLSDFTFTFHCPALEKEMATHSSVLAWRVPGTGEPGGLLSMGLHRAGHDWGDLAAAAGNTFQEDTHNEHSSGLSKSSFHPVLDVPPHTVFIKELWALGGIAFHIPTTNT